LVGKTENYDQSLLLCRSFDVQTKNFVLNHWRYTVFWEFFWVFFNLRLYCGKAYGNRPSHTLYPNHVFSLLLALLSIYFPMMTINFSSSYPCRIVEKSSSNNFLTCNLNLRRCNVYFKRFIKVKRHSVSYQTWYSDKWMTLQFYQAQQLVTSDMNRNRFFFSLFFWKRFSVSVHTKKNWKL
jgi:hypothetical protein